MILFTIYSLFTNDMMGMGEKKKPEKYMYMKNMKKFPVWLPSHPPVYEIGGQLFSGPKEPEISRAYPRWDGNSNLPG